MQARRYFRFFKRGLVHSGPPIHLTLFVTGACNLRCRHCFHWKEVAEGVPGPSLEDVDRLAASASRMGPLLWVSFGGGEPFLRADLPELARAFGSRGLRHLAIPTNGLVKGQVELTRRILLENPEMFLSVSVSFDGSPEIHDEIRQVPGGHARSMDGVRRLQELQAEHAQLGVGLILTVTRENQAELADHMEELVGELAPDNVTINLARGTALDESLLQVDMDRYRELTDRKRTLMDAGRLPYFDFPLARLAVARDEMLYERVDAVARGTGRHLPCTAGKISAVIFENGEVHPCEILGEPLGDLHQFDWDLERLWKTERADQLRAKIARERCSCTWECAQADNVLFHARNWPRLAWRGMMRP